jgi:hypothetical protein
MLETVDGIRGEDLLARPAKSGAGTARGPCVTPAAASPLAALVDGEKLHVVGKGSADRLSGADPEGLVDRLAALGLSPAVRLKQIHLIADHTGDGGERSFAARFDSALRARGFQVSEIKAPAGEVRCDTAGKIWVFADGAWYASNPALNYYAGPAIQEKHRT